MRIDKNYWLLNTPIAHRGLWNDKIVENSLSAYENAIKCGFPIEIDLYLTSDKKLVSFHDKDLFRMTGTSGLVFDKTLNELKKLRLLNTQEQIPTLDEVLSMVNGKVPLLIEFKDQPDKDFVKIAVDKLKSYKGEFAVQSFNPLYVNKIRKLAPKFIRGILATESEGKDKSLPVRYILKNMPLNFLCKPDFISYSYSGLPLKKRKYKNRPIITWTVTREEIYQKVRPYSENIIFENFIPKI